MHKVFLQTFEQECKNYDFDFKELYTLLSPHYEILKYVEEKRTHCMTLTKFKNNLQTTLDTFSELNNYKKESGYVKLSKRCSLLLGELDDYEKGTKKIHPKIEQYFNQKICKYLPTKSNILAIAYHNLLTFDNKKTEPDYLKEFIGDIFNENQNFNHCNPRYKKITIISLNKEISTIKNSSSNTEKGQTTLILT